MFEESREGIKRAQGGALIELAMPSRTLSCVRNCLIALRFFLFLLAYFISFHAAAIGLGELQVHSGIGQHLKVSIPLLGQDSEDILPTCVRGRVFNLDGSFISNANIQIAYDKRGKSIIATTHHTLSEPALSMQITIECGTHIERAWQVLLDMPSESIKLPSVKPTAQAAIAGSSENKPSRKANRQAMHDAQVESAPAASKPVAQTTPSNTRPRQTPTNPSRDVLQISKRSEAELEELHRLVLLMSGALSADSLAKVEAKELQNIVPQVSEEMRATRELANLQQKIRMLEADANRLQMLSNEQDRALQGTPSERITYFWLYGLGFVLVAAILAIAWLLWRMQQMRAEAQIVWHTTTRMDTPAEPASPAEPPPAQAAPSAPPTQKHSVRAAMPSTAGRVPHAAKQAAPAALSSVTSLPASSLQEKVEDFSLSNENLPTLDEMLPIDFSPNPNLRAHDLIDLPTVAEVTDAMHEAEFWMSLGKPEKAAEVLELYSRSENASSPVTWLYLFELYRSLGEEDKYAQLRSQFQRHFNGQIPAWDDALPDPVEHGLDSQKILLSRISMLWGTSQLIPFLESLIIDNREGMRTGFALPTYRDLLFLLDLAHAIEHTEPLHA